MTADSIRILAMLVVLMVEIGQVKGQCTPTFILPNIIKDLVTLTNDNSGQQVGNSYPYFPRMFSSQPIISYSISQIDIKSPGNYLNYYLDVIMDTTLIDFYFNAPNQSWTKITINIWLTSRNDIIAKLTTIQSIAVNQNATQVVTLTQFTNTTVTANSKHLVFIVGIYATLISDNFTVSANSAGINPAFATLLVNNGPGTFIVNITMISVIFDPDNSQFLSYAGTVTYTSFSTRLLNLYNNFVPLYYYLVGMASISATGTASRSLTYSLDISGTILNSTILQNGVTYASFGLNYVTIGMPMAQVCGNCNNTFFSDSNCISTCPIGTYRFTYQDNGKACLKCQASVGQQLNDLATGCSCLPGFEVLTTHQCISIASVPINCAGFNVIQNGTICICSPGTFNISGQCQSCPFGTSFDGSTCKQISITCTQPNTQLNSAGTSCICINGFTNYSGTCRPTCPTNSQINLQTLQCECSPNFMNISNSCTACQSDQTYDAGSKTCKCNLINQIVNNQGKCVCQDGYFNISNFCIQCPQGTVFLNGACAPTSCQQNQVLSDGKCICDSTSVKVGSVCVKCQNATFANNLTNTCQPCIANCLVCTNRLTCRQCRDNFVYDFSSQSCISTGNTNAAKVTVRSGFPVYSTTAIVTDFRIDSPASLPVMERQQLVNMIAVDFGTYQPKRVVLTQSPMDLNTIRVVLDYRLLLPMSPFNLSYRFRQASIGLSSNVTLSYNAANANLVTIMPD